MTSKERVQAALQRQNPARIPIFMWFHPITAEKLAAGLRKEEIFYRASGLRRKLPQSPREHRGKI